MTASPHTETVLTERLTECPKAMIYGPCGGVGMNGSCEVDRGKRCVWHNAEAAPDPEKIAALVQQLPEREQHPLRAGSRFERLLRAGHFVVTCELNPHDSADATALVEYARTLARHVDAGHISDNSLASPHMCGLAVAARVQEAGIEPILHMTCRDRNRLMLQADLLGAHALGVRNILCLTGDHPALGDHAAAKPVFDFDAVRFLQMMRRMRDEGRFESGERQLDVRPRVFIGGAAHPTAPPLDLRPYRFAQKLVAGADFVVTQLVFDMKALREYMKRLRDAGLERKTYLLVGVGALAGAGMARAINMNTPGVVVPEHVIRRLEGVPRNQRRAEGIKICVEQIQELREMPGVSGIDIMDLDPVTWFPTVEIVESAGLANRPQLE